MVVVADSSFSWNEMLSRKVKKEAVFGCGETEGPSRVEDIGLDIQARGRTKFA